jgi:hypothetical protein
MLLHFGQQFLVDGAVEEVGQFSEKFCAVHLEPSFVWRK